jgi:hypothetical protein
VFALLEDRKRLRQPQAGRRGGSDGRSDARSDRLAHSRATAPFVQLPRRLWRRLRYPHGAPQTERTVVATIVFPSTQRWVRCVSVALLADRDPRTLEHWAGLCAVSVPTLRTTCYLAGVAPRPALLFARLCRAICLANQVDCKPIDLLDVGDPRTTQAMVRRSGLSTLSERRTLALFLEDQTLIRSPLLLGELERSLREGAVKPGRLAGFPRPSPVAG